jgi:TolB-like protein
MSPTKADAQGAVKHLERVLESDVFARSEQLSRFLRFVVERHLDGCDHELKESVIGVEVFGRQPDYNPKHDPVVRTEARRLRARLGQFYDGEGSGDSLIIELPKGGHVPVIRLRAAEARRWIQPPAWLWVGIAFATVALVIIGWARLGLRQAPIPIAVLPLIDASQNSAGDYFADGLTAELISDLSNIEGLAVRSQTSSFVFKGKPRNVRDAGEQLRSDHILEGSVQRDEKRLRVLAQLVRVRDDFPLWSGKYDREVKDTFAIKDEISREIVNSLRLKLGRGRRRYEASGEAYDLYLRARALELQWDTWRSRKYRSFPASECKR